MSFDSAELHADVESLFDEARERASVFAATEYYAGGVSVFRRGTRAKPIVRPLPRPTQSPSAPLDPCTRRFYEFPDTREQAAEMRRRSIDACAFCDCVLDGLAVVATTHERTLVGFYAMLPAGDESAIACALLVVAHVNGDVARDYDEREKSRRLHAQNGEQA